MYRKRPRCAFLKRKKALLRSCQVFHAKCFQTIRSTNVIEIIVRRKSLEHLDLAVGGSNCKKKWLNGIRLKMIRCLPPNCAEYLLPENVFQNSTALGQEFKILCEFMEIQFDVFVQIQENFIHNLYIASERQVLSLNNYEPSQKKQFVRIYLKLVEIFRPFQLEISKYPFHVLYKSLLNTLCNELTVETSLAIAIGHWIKSACIDDESKMSVFLSISDSRCLEYLLCVARLTQFDLWGLLRGDSDLSKLFNPVAILFGDYGRFGMARILLKYGFQYSASGTVYEDRCHSLFFQRYRDMPIIDVHGVDLLLQKRPKDRMLLILDIFNTFSHFEINIDNSDSVLTLIYISRSLPSPHVTPTELFHSLCGVILTTFYKKLIQICKKYSSEDIYDDDYKEYKPRKLVHLCRCAVRKALANNLYLLEGLRDLNIPESLKKYLLLEC